MPVLGHSSWHLYRIAIVILDEFSRMVPATSAAMTSAITGMTPLCAALP
jgi:hypothetical protein